MANNPFQTPPASTPWPIPASANYGPLFATSGRVTRFQGRWNASSGIYASLYNGWHGGGSGLSHALNYLAAPSVTEAAAAFTSANGETFAQEPGIAGQLYCDTSPFVFDWCFPDLTGTQRSTLISKIESNNAARETGIAALGKFLLDGPANGGGIGLSGYIYGVISINGQPGATDRRTNLRNLVQNMTDYLTETYGDGWWASYAHIDPQLIACIAAYHIATGEESLFEARCPFLHWQGEVHCRRLSADFNHYYPMHHGCNSHWDSTGKIFNTFPGEAWIAALESDITHDPLSKYIQQQQNAHSTPTNWSHLQIASDPTWLGALFSDDSLPIKDPVAAGTPLSRAFPISGVCEMRSGWNAANDLVVHLYGGSNAQNDHTNCMAGCIDIRVGTTHLIKSGYAYPGRDSAWEAATGWAGGTTVGDWTMCKSGVSFSPSATQATREDRDGSASGGAPAGSSTAYPLSQTLTNGVRLTWKGGVMSNFSDDGTLAKCDVDYAAPYPQITSGKVTMGRKLGATTQKGTVVLWDQFVAPATIDHIRRNFWSFLKPTISGESVLSGGSTAGVLSATGDKVVIVNGSFQVTIQMVSTKSPILHAIGGAGFESWFDGYPTNGSNKDYLANDNGDARNTTKWLWLQNQWRTSFLTQRSIANGEMIFVLTVDAAGTTAPVYTRATALALLQPGGPQTLTAQAALSSIGVIATSTMSMRRAASALLAGGSVPSISSRIQSLVPVFIGSASNALTPNLAIQIQQDVVAGDSILLLAFSPDQATLLTTAQDSAGNTYSLMSDNVAAISPMKGTLPAGSTIILNFAGAPAPHAAVAVLIRGMTLGLAHVTALLQATGTSLVVGSGS